MGINAHAHSHAHNTPTQDLTEKLNEMVATVADRTTRRTRANRRLAAEYRSRCHAELVHDLWVTALETRARTVARRPETPEEDVLRLAAAACWRTAKRTLTRYFGVLSGAKGRPVPSQVVVGVDPAPSEPGVTLADRADLDDVIDARRACWAAHEAVVREAPQHPEVVVAILTGAGSADALRACGVADTAETRRAVLRETRRVVATAREMLGVP